MVVSLPAATERQRMGLGLLFTVPFTASPTNAIEMNNAMTSSVDLEKSRTNQLSAWAQP